MANVRKYLLDKEIASLEKTLETLKSFSKEEALGDLCQSVLPTKLLLSLILPEADIDGLHFNETKVEAVFEKKDGWYYSRDILFLSARNVEDDNDHDILTEYLQSKEFRDSLWTALPDEIPVDNVDKIKVRIPEENQGVKKYNGVDWWYWLAPAYSSALFASIYGFTTDYNASSVGGCAPAFCILGLS